MIVLKNAAQIGYMKDAGRITGEALAMAGEAVRPGISTLALDTKIRHYIEKCGAKPSFLGYGGFPGSACISVNEQVIHGIPSEHKILKDGDIVKIDVGAYYHGYHGDCANTFPVGEILSDAARLIEATKKSFYLGIGAICEGARIGDIGFAIDEYVRSCGFSVVKKYIGHGVGRELHEAPDVPNFGTRGRGPRLCPGMVIAVEPMVNIGGSAVRELSDEWTVITADGSLSAHYEHTVAITDNGILLLTDVSQN